jgi:hypothetical protein
VPAASNPSRVFAASAWVEQGCVGRDSGVIGLGVASVPIAALGALQSLS